MKEIQVIYILCIIFNAMHIGVGLLLTSKTSSEMNSVIGFRTKISSKNSKNWNFANQLFGKILLNIGFFA